MKKIILLLLSSAGVVWAQQEKVTLCHVPPGNPENAVTIETANPSAHIDPQTGEGAEGHELDSPGRCEDGPPDLPDPPDSPDPPEPAPNGGSGQSVQVPSDPTLISCVLFPAYSEGPLLVLTNVNDHDGYALVRVVSPDFKDVKHIPAEARGRAELDRPDPTFRGFLEVKAYSADIRSVLEHDRPGKGITREYGMPCWPSSDVALYGRWGVVEMTDWWPSERREILSNVVDGEVRRRSPEPSNRP